MADPQELADHSWREFGEQVEVEVDPPNRRGRVLVGVLYDRERFDSVIFSVSRDREHIVVLDYKDPLTLDQCVEHVRQLLATVGQPRPRRSVLRRLLTWPSD